MNKYLILIAIFNTSLAAFSQKTAAVGLIGNWYSLDKKANTEMTFMNADSLKIKSDKDVLPIFLYKIDTLGSRYILTLTLPHIPDTGKIIIWKLDTDNLKLRLVDKEKNNSPLDEVYNGDSTNILYFRRKTIN